MRELHLEKIGFAGAQVLLDWPRAKHATPSWAAGMGCGTAQGHGDIAWLRCAKGAPRALPHL